MYMKNEVFQKGVRPVRPKNFQKGVRPVRPSPMHDPPFQGTSRCRLFNKGSFAPVTVYYLQ